MQSAEHDEEDSAALALSKTSNNKENNDSSSVRPRLRSAGRLRGLGHASAARDAPELEIIELSDGERDALRRAELALEQTQPTAPKVAKTPSDRTKRAAGFAQIRGHEEVDVDDHVADAMSLSF